ncbi:MAG: hypothetical protein IPK67_14505 [Planctomycetes bacterium]|nr:hypothetical protein [Planctomycetota bacterium]
MIRASRTEWLAWALLWCAARSWLVLSFADVFGYGEEPEKACAAKAMLDGLSIPHHQLAYHYYEGGGFVVSHLDAAAFALFGESVLAVKLVALFLGVLALGAGWLLCDRLGGRPAARGFALLFVFAPESVQKLSLLTLGIHFHALIFVGLVLAGTLLVLRSRGQDGRAWFGLGLAAGFGAYFSYVLVLTDAVALAALALGLRRDLLRKPAAWGFLGLFLGALPLLWMASRVGLEVLDIHGAQVIEDGGPGKWALLTEFSASVFLGRDPFDLCSLALLVLSPLLGLFALGRGAEAGLRTGARLVLANAALFTAAYLAGGFTVGRVYHYFLLNRLTPLWWFALVFTVLGAAAAWQSRVTWKRSLAAAVIAGQALCGAVDLVSQVRASARSGSSGGLTAGLARLAETKGYTYGEYLRKLAPHLAGTPAEKLAVLLAFREPAPEMLHEGLVLGLGDEGPALGVEAWLLRAREAGVEDPRGFLLGCGPLLRKLHAGDLASRARAIEGYPPELRAGLYEALGTQGLGLHATEERLIREIAVGVQWSLPEAYFIGLGRRMHRVRGSIGDRGYFELVEGPWMFSRARAEQFAAAQAEPIGRLLLAGFEAADRASRLARER